jgi:hypothetical protein
VGLRDVPPGLIQTGNVATRLIAAFGIKGKVVSPRLGDLLHPVVLVEDLTRPGNVAKAPTNKTFSAVGNIAAVALQGGIFVINNPLTSGVVCRVVRVVGSAVLTAECNVGIADTAALPATNENEFPHDNRNLAITPIGALSGTDATLRIVNIFSNERIPANGTRDFFPSFTEPFVLNPGSAFGIQSATVNQGIIFGITWTEYVPT